MNRDEKYYEAPQGYVPRDPRARSFDSQGRVRPASYGENAYAANAGRKSVATKEKGSKKSAKKASAPVSKMKEEAQKKNTKKKFKFRVILFDVILIGIILLASFVLFHSLGMHNFPSEPNTVIAPTCTEDGSTTYICRFCGHEEVLVRADQKKLGHTFGEWKTIVAPTCTKDGVVERVCTAEGCGEKETRTAPMLNHNFSEEIGACTNKGCGKDVSASAVLSFDMSKDADGSINAYVLKVGKAYELYIVGDGDMKDFTDKTNPLVNKGYAVSITAVHFVGDITSIGDYAFYKCSSLTSITIPDGCKRIGAYAFAGTGLTFSTVPASVTEMGDGAFSACKNLETVNYASGSPLATINESLFDGDKALKNIKLPAGVSSIGAYAFRGCETLSANVVGAGVIEIGAYAFENCKSMRGADLSGVTRIPDGAFLGCASLSTVKFSESLNSVGRYAFFGCASIAKLTLPKSVMSIGADALCGLDSLTDITLPFVGASPNTNETNTNFKYIFGGIVPAKLTKVTVLGGVEVKAGAFAGVAQLQQIDFRNASIEKIGDGAFKGCSGLLGFVIPQSVTEVGEDAFEGCSNITTMTTPYIYGDGFGYLFGDTEFNSKFGMTVEITNVTVLAAEAFRGCDYISAVILPAGLNTIGKSAFEGCTKLSLIKYAKNNTEYADNELPTTVTTLEDGVFANCTSLTEISLPGVETIGNLVFKGCSKLKEVELSLKLEEIGFRAFAECVALEEIVIPAGVERISIGAFEGCSKAKLAIKCEVAEADKPDGWDEHWNFYQTEGTFVEYDKAVEWGYVSSD